MSLSACASIAGEAALPAADAGLGAAGLFCAAAVAAINIPAASPPRRGRRGVQFIVPLPPNRNRPTRSASAVEWLCTFSKLLGPTDFRLAAELSQGVDPY